MLRGAPMTTEERRIIFSDEEVVGAVKALYHRAKETFPPGNVWNVAISEDNGCQIDCDVVDAKGRRDRVTVAGERLAAALILHCIMHKVPLPAKAQKALTIVQGKLALNITLPGGPQKMIEV
jgi:hypothetical protein